MKRIVISILLAFSMLNLFAAANETDAWLFSEVNSAYKSGFYPGVVQNAEILVKKFPESAYRGATLVIEGESLVRLGQTDKALEVLVEAVKIENQPDVLMPALYWLGRTYELTSKNENALTCYFEYCRSGGEKAFYFAPAIFNSANIYYKTGDFKKAVPNYEYVVKNGAAFASDDYSVALLKLADSYNRSGSPEKTVSLYSKFSKDQLELKIYYVFTEYAGDAFALQKKYRRAYELYCEVLESGEKSLAATALKKAYNVSSAHKNEVGAEPGVVLQNAQKSLKDSPELLAEFWTRLGTDAFNNNDFTKALSYFDEAEKYPLAGLEPLIVLYRAEIKAGKPVSAESALAADSYLTQEFAARNLTENADYSDSYYKLRVKYAVFQKNWNDVKKFAELIEYSDDFTNYYVALAQYETGDYAASAKLLSGRDDELYALSLARQQKLKEAAGVYGSSDKKSAITPEERLNYAKVLLLSGRYKEAQIEANKCGLNEGKYILGLAQFNTWNWNYAEDNFASYLKNIDKKDSAQKKSVSYARFYQGYAQYRQGKFAQAFENLMSFIAEYPSHELLWNAEMTVANTAVQLGKFESGINMADAAIRSATNNQNKEEAVLLCAEIYSDAGKYEKALNLLSSYSKQKNTFGMKCLYAMAQIYEKIKQSDLADAKYKEMADRFGSEKMAEEAMYRRGEMYFALSEYDAALKRFTEYSSRYSGGSYIESSWYFSAECLDKLENKSRAILQYQALIKKFPESTYVYASARKLVDLYRAEGKYKNALENASFLLEKFGEQARNDGIAAIASDLEKLASGKNEEIVRLENAYRNAGGNSSAAGRKAGTELAVAYANSTATANEAVKLAEQILPLQKKSLKTESFYAAKNADILGQAYRLKNRNKLSAEMFLSAAEYYRMNGKDGLAAAALYGAYDAFIAANMIGDANETARTIKSLYPSSIQAGAVKTDN
ncbi:MAG: tetratricopeptide repeat protein [Treponema sp.]|nr:tetratricopeptide repeat protein [Treponema sp.]